MATTKSAEKVKWSIDPAHSEIAFKVKHLMITNVKGVFKEFNATIFTGEDLVPTDLEVSINAASVDTGDANRDGHLRSADFFDTENFNNIVFKSNSYKKVNEHGHYELSGDMTIKGVKKPIKLDVEFEGVMKDPWGNEKAGYTINGTINRKEWGLNWNAALEAGGVLVSDDVKITSEVQLVRQA